ncbi:ribosomal protein L21 [secondary endosymbiont of Heteropsylla cubana]|uniref:Large ribosomal subunit protein bL21 n=1 Tax=secondary endosymbiont of Heteropsylla cubana TaxID=134287 RepID=J3YSQ5_9ENTR|nr:50S ribosomal protein L21 [secondary endosymbiont of Heteropsylla cubana]AFP85343.1 ribosomal protein L21 [secondary endosymbiont of Heteropsylla cubana]
MYAVFQSGGKQHRVSVGQTVRLEKLDVEIGKTINFEKVMMVAKNNNVHIGQPFIKDIKIIAEVLTHGRSHKVMILKFRRRKHFRKQRGHRQCFTEVKIIGVHGLIGV